MHMYTQNVSTHMYTHKGFLQTVILLCLVQPDCPILLQPLNHLRERGTHHTHTHTHTSGQEDTGMTESTDRRRDAHMR